MRRTNCLPKCFLLVTFQKKTFEVHITFSIFRAVRAVSDQFRTKEWEKIRKSLDHNYIVKFHHSYNEGGRVWSFVIEPLIIAGRTMAQQRTNSLKEYSIWRDLSTISSALACTHSQPRGPVLALDLSPLTVNQVCMNGGEEGGKVVHMEAAAARLKHRGLIWPDWGFLSFVFESRDCFDDQLSN